MKKEDRMYPMMPPYPYGMPMMPYVNTNTCEDNKLKEEIESLKKRVSYIENNLANNYNYNSSNYQVM